jgi:GntR family transcriptional regulator
MTDVAYQPQYRQIEQALRERIAALPPGAKLPSDTDLCAEFGVSRMTARNAMERSRPTG